MIRSVNEKKHTHTLHTARYSLCNHKQTKQKLRMFKNVPSLMVMLRSSSFLKRTVCTPEIAFTTVDLPCATWPIVPMLMVAWREITSGDSGVSLVMSCGNKTAENVCVCVRSLVVGKCWLCHTDSCAACELGLTFQHVYTLIYTHQCTDTMTRNICRLCCVSHTRFALARKPFGIT